MKLLNAPRVTEARDKIMNVEILEICNLKIASQEVYIRKENLPPHDLAMLKDLKAREHWDKYIDDRKGNLNKILELGIRFGGSIPYLFDLCDADFIAGVDIAAEDISIRQKLNRSTLKDHFELYFDTNQTDRPKLNKILDNHFSDGVVLVVDDASHLLLDTRKSFEILFPHLTDGGLYIIEDYSWAHNEAFAMLASDRYRNQPAMSQLAMEIIMLMNSTKNWITRISCDYNTIIVERGNATIPNDFSMYEESQNWAFFDNKTLKGELR